LFNNLFFHLLKTTDWDTKIISSSDLLPTPQVDNLVKDVKEIVKSIMKSDGDFEMFKTVCSIKVQTLPNTTLHLIVATKVEIKKMHVKKKCKLYFFVANS